VSPHDVDVAARATATDDHVVTARLTRRFEEHYNRPPDAVFAAPGRVNLIGEHTDYNDGWCLPVALAHSTYAAVAPRDDDVVRITSLQQDTSFQARMSELSASTIRGWAAYAAGVLWALREAGTALPGMDLLIDSEVPVGAGLSSSAALECAVALAACSLAGVAIDTEARQRLVTLCMRAETEVAGAPTGGMDQTVCLLAEPSSALLIDCLTRTTENVAWRAAEAGVQLLVVDTRVSHSLADGQYADRSRECAEAARLLGVSSLRDVGDLDQAIAGLPTGELRRRVRHVHTENARVHAVVRALRAGDLELVGRHFYASHASLRDDFEVTCDELDVVVEAARGAGALGARMTGGGFGGSAVVLAPETHVRDIKREVSSAFAAKGWLRPRFLRATPSAGARQIHAHHPDHTIPLH
jgi:galactokinase